MVSKRRCWCGNTDLADFSPQYLHCGACQTLVAREIPEPQIHRVISGKRHFYDREYWYSYQEEVLGLPNIDARARSDLYDRCPYWLRMLLKYLHPPAAILELGSGNGSFAFLMRSAGFDVTGLELTPWLCDYVKNKFDVPMLTGALEDQNLSEGSLDAVVMMDVLEHLPDPLKNLHSCKRVLRPDGLLMIQTPCYPEGLSMAKMKSRKSRFPEVMRDRGHLLLYSRSSVSRLMAEAGFEHMVFEPAVFSHYDMFFFASRKPLRAKPPEAADRLLEQTAEARLVRALIDLKTRFDVVAAKLERFEKLKRIADRFGGRRLLQWIRARRRGTGGSQNETR